MNKEKFRVLIVDDEEKDRSIVKILLQRQYEDLFEILEAGNAAEAKEALAKQQVDLLMADIHMPGVNGLELVKELRETNARLYIMILTAYNYFEYAKEAIRYQVNDFLLKPPIRTEFYEAVQRFLDWAREERDGRQLDETAQKVFTRELGERIMMNADRKKIDAYKELLHIREDRVFCILVDTSVAKDLKAASFQDEIEDAMDASGLPYAVCHMQDRTAIFCFTGQETLRYDEVNTTVDLKMKLSLALGENTNIAVGDVVSVYHHPSESYRSAVARLNVPAAPGSPEAAVEDQVIAHIRAGETEDAVRTFSQYLLHYGERHNFDDLMLKDIEILTVVRKSAQVPEERIRLKIVDIFATGSIQDIVRFSAAYLRAIVENSAAKSPQKMHYAVQRICKRLAEHVEQSWNINDFAREYGFNPFYLSRLFKDETGLSFTDYLTEKRVEKAIVLMSDTNLTIGEIGQAVGYSDQNYFSRVFKKRTKMGPKEYRRSHITGQRS